MKKDRFADQDTCWTRVLPLKCIRYPKGDLFNFFHKRKLDIREDTFYQLKVMQKIRKKLINPLSYKVFARRAPRPLLFPTPVQLRRINYLQNL